MNQIAPSQPDLKSWLGLMLLGLIWGASFMAVTIAGTGFGPLSIAAGRITLGALALFILSKTLRLPLPNLRGGHGKKVLLAALGLGMFSMVFPFFLLSWGQVYVSSGFAGVTMAAGPLLTLVLAHFLIPSEGITLPKSIGITLGFIGVVLLIGLDAFRSSGMGLEPLARIACVGAAACYAIGAIITRRAPSVEPISFATTATILAAIIILPAALIIEGVPANPNTNAILAVVFLGLVPTAIANLLLVAIIRRAGPSFMSLVNYQVPVWSLFFGWIFLKESISPNVFIALALILSGVAISQSFKRKKT